jgi:excisionase family DNA binding protein
MNKKLPTTDTEKSIQELYSENPNLVTIQKAANALKVSKDTLRRWEAKGKITSIRTTSGYRLYDLKTLSKAAKSKSNAEVSKPEVVSKTIIPPFNQQTPLIPEVKTAAHSFYEFANLNPQIVQLPSHQSNTKFDPVKKVSATKQFSQSSLPQAVSKQGLRFYTVIALLLLTLLGTVSAAYVYLPGVNQSAPAKYIAGLIKKDINSIKPSREVAITQSKSEVLAASSIAKEGKFLQLNLDTNIVGNLAVEGEGVFTENITAPNILYSLNPGTNITITGDPQNPTISTSLALEDATYTTKGIASFSSTFFTVTDGAVTIADGSLTGDQIDDGTVTNSNLANSSITINAGSGLSGGGTVSLGGSITLTASGGSVSGVSTITGTADQVIASASTGDITLSLPQSIGTTSNVEFDSLELTTGLLLNGSTSGTITVAAPATVTSYTLSLPSDDGTNGYVLQTDGSGNTSWVAQSGGASSLQDAYDGGNTIATTTGRNLAFTLSSGLATSTSLTLTNAGTASAFVLNDTNGATNTSIEVQSGGSPTLTITEAGTLATSGNISTSGSGTITSAGTLTASNGFL